MKKLSVLCLLVVLAFSSACQHVPITGRNRVLFTSRGEENQLGFSAWQEIRGKEKQVTSGPLQAAVIRIGRNVAQVAKQDDFQWEFVTFESKQANAFCLPGGKVGVYTGLFKFADNDAELATVIAHEIGHAIARHGGERMSHGMLQNAAASLMSHAGVGSQAMMAFGLVSQVGGVLPFSRTHEYEADEIGMIMMARAGYDPNAAISFWAKFGADSKTDELGEFFSTHPMSNKRLDAMKLLLPKALSEYSIAPVRRGFGQRYK